MYLRTYTATEITNKWIRLSKLESQALRKRFEETFCTIDSEQYKSYKREHGHMLWDC